MVTRLRLTPLWLSALWPAVCGCSSFSPPIWTDMQQELRMTPTGWTDGRETIPYDKSGLETLEVQTYNGSISFRAEPMGQKGAVLMVTKLAGGRSLADAEEALDAIEVYVETTGEGVQHVGWRWLGDQRPDWTAQVSFEILGSSSFKFNGRTHNGRIEVVDAGNDVRVVTQNGRIDVSSSGDTLIAETHDGRIYVVFSGRNLSLSTTNGAVFADLGRAGPVRGSITTDDGPVEIVFGEKTAADIRCRTEGGDIICAGPISNVVATGDHELSGRIGAATGTLEVGTRTGHIAIRNSIP